MEETNISQSGQKVKGKPFEHNNKRVFTPIDKAEYLLRTGAEMSKRFESSAVLNKDPKALAKADFLQETYRADNIYTSKDVVNYKTGEVFDGYGVLQVGVASRVSPAYQKSSSLRANKKTADKIAKHKQQVGQEWRFATFTLPFLKTDVWTVLKIISRAMELLKKRKIFRLNVDGAFFGEEMTIGDGSNFDFTHYHVHIHALLLGKYITQWELADEWTECVEKACGEFGVDFSLPSLETNRLVVDIRRTKKRGKQTMENALLELCKYTVKGSDFGKVPLQELTEIEEALCGRQMVKSYGIFNNRKGKGKTDNISNDPLLDTNYTFDGATFKPKLKRAEKKVKSLVKLGEEMISEGRREDWLKVLRITMQTRREYRRDYLAQKYPQASFTSLDGKSWFGVSNRLKSQ